MSTEVAGTTAADELASNKRFGKWEAPFAIDNVACHATLLPNGKILCWSRRSNPMSASKDDMNEQQTNAFLIDMNAQGGPKCTPTGNQPRSSNFDSNVAKNSSISLFCSGHCLQPDGTLFVVGGHIRDGIGLRQACVYDYRQDVWTPQQPPNAGRWYPSALTLPDGSVLTISGNDETGVNEPIPQIWSGTEWNPKLVQRAPGIVLHGYPRLHLDFSGRVLIAGPNGQCVLLDTNTTSSNEIGTWGLLKTELQRDSAVRENGASVTYDVGKVLWTGGGNDGVVNSFAGPPTNTTEMIDLNVANPKGQPKPPKPEMNMNFKRRHHNLTTLPDGTVLVTGGTQGLGFNDLRNGQPVHTAELWNPANQKWTNMAAESIDRCYHGNALLLPDGSVLSLGSGEGGEFDAPPNPPEPDPTRDNHTDAQIFRPPYLFNSEPPEVVGIAAEVQYGQSFDVTVTNNQSIGRISWIRLPSVTHGTNSSQSVVFRVLNPPQSSPIKVMAPRNRNAATPGHYMLFFVNTQGRPSVASMIRISPEKTAEERMPQRHSENSANIANIATAVSNERPVAMTMAQPLMRSLAHSNEKVVAGRSKHSVKIGLTPVCPYGLGACWAGAFEGLQHIDDIGRVEPQPDQDNSVAFVYLKEDKLPDINAWRDKLAQTAGGAYHLRGIELTVTGTVTKNQVDDPNQLILSGTSAGLDLFLAPFKASSMLERDHKARELRPASRLELSAYQSLFDTLTRDSAGMRFNVTGRLHKPDGKNFGLDVRSFNVGKNDVDD